MANYLIVSSQILVAIRFGVIHYKLLCCIILGPKLGYLALLVSDLTRATSIIGSLGIAFVHQIKRSWILLMRNYCGKSYYSLNNKVNKQI